MQFAEAKPLEVILNEIVARVRKFANADGAAIAIRDGEFVVTRATTGGIAPDIGARMSIQGSFTGLCLEKRSMLHCEDSDTDSRVDAKVCRLLNTRSFVVVPIEGMKEPQGVLAAFSAAPHAFTRTDIAVLKTASDQIKHALANVQAADAGSPLPVESAVQQKNVVPLDGAQLKARLAGLREPTAPPAPVPSTPIAIVPATPRASQPKIAERTIPAATQPRISTQTTAAAVAKSQEPALVSLAESIGAPAKAEPAAPRPVIEQLPDGFREQYLGWKGFETSEPASRFSRKWIVGGVAACVLLVGGTVGMSMRKPSPLKITAAVSTPDAATVRAAEVSTPAPSQPVPTPLAQPVTTPAPKSRAASETAATATSAPKSVAVMKQPALVVDSSSPKPQTPVVPEIDAPQISIASANTSILPDMKTIAPGAPRPTAKESELEPSELIRKVMPQFPKFTNAVPVTQTVILHARVLVDGSIGDVQVVQGRSEFGEAAKTAVKQWRYKPARKDGKPVETSVTVTINFKR